MNTRTFSFYSLAALIASSAWLAAACSSDKNDEPTINANGGSSSYSGTGARSSSGGTATTGGAGGTGAATSTGGSTPNPSGGSAGSGAAPSTGGTAGVTATGGSSGLGTGGSAGAAVDCNDTAKKCFKNISGCTPKEPTEFLNRCSDGKCIPYDNSTLTKLVGGKVPEVP